MDRGVGWWTSPMQLVTPAPSAIVPDPTPAPAPVHRAPSTLTVPSLDDGSASAMASLDQVASYVGMLKGALADDPSFYARLVKRGFLDSAIDYAKYAYSVIDYDKSVDNDGIKGIIDGAVLEALLAASTMGTPAVADPNLVDELAMAGAAASNSARGLEALVTKR
jgi:hypothetical protein